MSYPRFVIGTSIGMKEVVHCFAKRCGCYHNLKGDFTMSDYKKYKLCYGNRGRNLSINTDLKHENVSSETGSRLDRRV